MVKRAACAGIVLMLTTLLPGCAPQQRDLSDFTLFEFGQAAVPDDFRYPDVLWARIRKTEGGQYRLQMALIIPNSTQGQVQPERDLTAEEVQRMQEVFSGITFWSDFTSQSFSRDIIAPVFRWDNLYSQPGNTIDVISSDSQIAIVTFLRDLATP